MERCIKCFQMKVTPNSKCLCNFGTVTENKKPKPINKVSEKKKERLKNEGTEGKLFEKIYKNLKKEGNNICAICNVTVKEGEVQPACFPHILPKGKYPEFRYFTNNIGFVCGIVCHGKFDITINKIKRKIGLFEFEQIIRDGKKINIKNYIDKN